MIRHEVFDSIGYLDEGYGMGWGEDDQFCERAAKAGIPVGVALGAYVEHVHRGTWSRVLDKRGLYERWMHAQAHTADWRMKGEPVYIDRPAR